MQRPLRWFGNVLAGIHFNSVTPGDTSSSRCFVKTRRRHVAFMVPLANWYAARLGIRMRVLTRSIWFWYEPLMYQILLGRSVSTAGGALMLPRLPGRTLLSLLETDGTLSGEQELGLSLAAAELDRLHTCRTPHPWDGRLQEFSHADATIDNVLVDTTQRRAYWIDFETVHDPSLPATLRHADDLLTLLCGAAALIDPEQLSRLFQILLRNYPRKQVAGAMFDLIRHWGKHSIARRISIPALTDDQWQRLHAAMASLGGNHGR